MAWYEMKSAGLPSGLQNNMDSVLNKKFGTSTTYAPETWPAEVNLLGPLPIKTASGAIASFSDGADDVPISDCKFYFNPKQASGTPSPSNPLSISGWEGLTIYHGKKNVFDITTYPITKKRYIRASDGYFAISTIDLRGATEDYIPCASMRGKTWVINKPNQSGNTMGIAFYDENKAFLSSVLTWPSGTNGVFTVPEDAYYFRFTVDLDSADDTEVQIEAGSAATAYSAYATPETKSVTWTEQGTIYGGSIDNSGVLTDAYIKINLWELPCTRLSTSVSGKYRFQLTTENLYAPSTSVATVGKCNVAVPISADYLCGAHDGIAVRNSTTIHMYDENYATDTALNFKAHLQEIGAYAVLPLRTSAQTTYQLSPLNLATYYGDNNFWSDGDTASVDYRADIALALAALQGNRSLGLMTARPDPEEPEEEPEEPEER